MFCLKQINILAASWFQSKLSEDHRISRHSLASDCRLWLCSKSSYEECVYVCCHGSARLPVTIWGVSSILENIYILIQSKPKTYCNNVYVLWFLYRNLQTDVKTLEFMSIDAGTLNKVLHGQLLDTTSICCLLKESNEF